MGNIKNPPLRMCCVCRLKKQKKDMLKIIKSPDNEIMLDLTYKQNGRGAYVCKTEACVNKCVKTKALNRSFSMDIPKEIYEQLLSCIAGKG